MKLKFSLIIFLLVAALSSCVTNRKLTYIQYDGSRSPIIKPDNPAEYTIMPYDNLFVKVVTPDPQWSAMFNTMPVASYSISVTEQSADLVSYSVDGAGYIMLPYAGKVKVAGKTLSMITEEVDKTLKGYIADASVTVKMVNNYVSLIGEFQRPGRYELYKERMNVFQALAMGGDLTEFSNRQKIQVIRQTNAGNIIKEFTLTDRSIMASEFFYVMPNDVIYAMPMKGKFFRMSEFPYSVLLSTVTTFILLWNVMKF